MKKGILIKKTASRCPLCKLFIKAGTECRRCKKSGAKRKQKSVEIRESELLRESTRQWTAGGFVYLLPGTLETVPKRLALEMARLLSDDVTRKEVREYEPDNEG